MRPVLLHPWHGSQRTVSPTPIRAIFADCVTAVDADRMFTVCTTTEEYHFDLPTKYKFKEWTKALRECVLQYKEKEKRVENLKAREASKVLASLNNNKI